MLSATKRIFYILFAVLALFFFLYVLGALRILADLAANLHPALYGWCMALGILAVAGGVWFLAAPFFRPQALSLPRNPSQEDLRNFRRELCLRLRQNSELAKAGIVLHRTSVHTSTETQNKNEYSDKGGTAEHRAETTVADNSEPRNEANTAQDPEYYARECGFADEDVQHALQFLHKKANDEVRQTAKYVFISSALSQNGRLDSLLVFCLLARLIWRLSALYNQRPSYNELTTLYSNVIITSFFAASIEDFGVEEVIGGIITPAMASSSIGALPGAEAIAATLTTSLIDGSTNALLTLRVGFIARNYLSGAIIPGTSIRRNATIEALSVLADITGDSVKRIIVKAGCAAGSVLGEKMASAFSRAATAAKEGAKASANAVGEGAKAGADAAKTGVESIGNAAKAGIKAVHSAAKLSAHSIGNAAVHSAKAVENAAKQSADAVSSAAKAGAHSAEHAAKIGAKNVKNTAKQSAETVERLAHNSTNGLRHAATAVLSKFPFSKKSEKPKN